MKKRLLALLLAGAMSVGLAACGNSGDEGSANTPAGGETTPVTDGTGEPSAEGKTVKVGMVCIGDENDQGYTYNFMKAVEEATAQLAEQGITVEWSYKKNILEDSGCEDANIELADAGCQIIINNSYGFESYMLKVAPDYPEIEFISCTNQASAVDDLANTHNAFANIYEGRYLAGVAGGMKLQQLIDEGTITADEAVIGYVAAFPFAEVVSGYTAFYLGAKSVCPSVTMKVKYVNSWSNASEEAAAAADWLEEMGYLDDADYARRVVEHYSARGCGPAKLRDELYRRGVPRDCWDDALAAQEPPEGAIDALLQKKLRGADPSDPRALKRAADALARRGYRWEEIQEGLERYRALSE